MLIVADQHIPFLQGVLEPYAEVRYLPGSEISPAHVRHASALLTRTRTRCDAALLQGSSVSLVASATIGYDHIDTGWCEAHGVDWTNSPGCNANSVNEYVVSALLSIAEKTGHPLSGLRIGVIGVGHVGSRVAHSAEVLGMQVLRCDPPLERSGAPGLWYDFAELLHTCDVLSFHVPLNRSGPDRTLHMLDSDALAHARSGQWILNTSRGPVVDNTALQHALSAGRLGGAILDVWENEPGISRDLLGSVYLGTPHIAGYSADGKANATSQVVRALARRFGITALESWAPDGLPAPDPILVDTSGLTDSEALRSAVRASYDIRRDAAGLRRSPERFEEHRNQYWTRREFAAYRIRGALTTPMRELGFKPA